MSQPGLEASWSTLLAALGGRLPMAPLERELADLRLWGLADYRVGSQAGTFATYPAVAAGLPRGLSLSLPRWLQSLNSETLRNICMALGLSSPPTTKDGRAQRIMSTLTDSAACRAAVERAPQPAQALFAWIREQGGRAAANDIMSWLKQHGFDTGSRGGYPAFAYLTPGYLHFGSLAKSPVEQLLSVGLLVPVEAYPGGYYPIGYGVADEVELAYSGREFFDTVPLQPPELQSAPGVTGAEPSPTHLLRDLGHLLGFLASERCEWRQDGQPYKRSLQALGKAIQHRDDAYLELLWELAQGARLVQPKRQSGFEPVPLGAEPPGALFQRLLQGWRDGPPWSYFSGSFARTCMLQTLATLPPDTWIRRQSVEALMTFLWPLVFTADGGTPPPLLGHWSALERLILASGTTADGAPAVLVPANVQSLLQEETVAATLPAWEEEWVVQPDRSIVAPPTASPQSLQELWQIAELETNQGAPVFRISGQTIAAALNRGLPAADVRGFLTRRSRTPIPPTVERLIQDQESRYGQVRVGAASAYVQTTDPASLEEMMRRPKLRDLKWHVLAPGTAVVTGLEPTTVRDALRKAGYLPVLDGPAAAAARPEARAMAASRTPAARPADVCRLAIDAGLLVSVTWDGENGTEIALVEPWEVSAGRLYGEDVQTGDELLIPLRAASISLVDPSQQGAVSR